MHMAGGEWMSQYENLFKDPWKAQKSWETETPKSGTQPDDNLYWRGTEPIPDQDVPDWAKSEADRVRTSTPGKEFQGKSEEMMNYLQAVGEGRKSYATEAADAAAQRAEAEAQGRLKGGPWTTAGQRAAGYAGGEAGMEIGAQGAIAAQKEKQAAQQAYMQAQAAQRTQDVNTELQLEALSRQYKEAGMTDEQARAEALRQFAKDQLTRYGMSQKLNQIREESEQKQLGAFANLAGTVFSSVAGGISDKRLKKDIKPADKDVSEFLNAIHAKKWNWKDNNKSDVGIIAQDLEKSTVGKTLVQKREDGMKGYTFRELQPVVLASLAHINKRLSSLEKK